MLMLKQIAVRESYQHEGGEQIEGIVALGRSQAEASPF